MSLRFLGQLHADEAVALHDDAALDRPHKNGPKHVDVFMDELRGIMDDMLR